MDGRTDDAPSGRDKASLRSAMRAVWQESDVASLERAVADRLLSLPEVGSATTVAAYDGLPGEIATDLLRAELAARGLRVLLPVLLDDGALSWRVSSSAPLVPGRRGTRHPPEGCGEPPLSAADVVVVPGLAFDLAGRRLGRGGGSYDRALRDVRDDAVVIGVAVDGAVLGAVPAEPHDRPVHVVVTPTRVIRTAARGC